jgi:dienelactone hydrolase
MIAAMKPTRRDFLAGAAALPIMGATALPAEPELKPTGANLGSLFSAIEKVAAEPKYSLSFLGGGFRSVEDFRRAGRDRVFELLHYRPEKVEPKAEVVEREEREDHVREKVLFSTSPHFRVPAYVLIPKGLKKPAPAIVDLHSHGGMFLFGKEKVVDLGKNHPTMTGYHQRNYDGRPTATEFVKRGYVVISIDALFFGERRALLDEDVKYGYDHAKYTAEDVSHLNQKCRGKERTLVNALAFAGMTWPGVVFWDDIRTVDYLVSRSEVDPKRVGCLGISMGGYRTMFLAALDERIKAACITGFMSTVRPMMKAHVDTHSNIHFIHGLHAHLDWPDVASLHAPMPLMVQQCSQDKLFPLQGMKDSVAKIEAAYEKANCKEQFSGRFYDEPHIFTKKMQDDAFQWFDGHLKDGKRG